ncbi:DUF2716 domain-containing protein [Kitasatospora sp. NPDC048722]|uniref:DUF2716 domain-containing protein n=1 Tax=Kitasatospora sp. NPDC048722 TaxID=3155639 RepID=UPI0033E82FBE
MTTEALRRLNDSEHGEIWNRFQAAFDFRPDTSVIPGISEPASSVTWSLDALDDDPGYRKLDRLVGVVQDGLARCCPPGEALWLLDQPHTSYRLRPDLVPDGASTPRVVEGRPWQGWPLSPYPDGNHSVQLAEDFRFGVFGHPSEKSICVFGADLLDAIADEVAGLLPHVIRRDGEPVG